MCLLHLEEPCDIMENKVFYLNISDVADKIPTYVSTFHFIIMEYPL